MARDVLRRERPRAVHAQAGVLAGRRPEDRHLGVAIVPAHEAPEGRGREVAQHGAGTARLHRGQEATLERDIRVPDGVHGPMDRMQPAVANADADRVAREPAVAQLVEREHAPLLGGPAGDLHVGPAGDCHVLPARSRHIDPARDRRINPSVDFVGLRLTESTLGGWELGTRLTVAQIV
jgi:hypothetical protein